MDKTNRPHVTPVFFIFISSTASLYFLTPSKSKKLASIRSNPEVALTIDLRDPVDPHNNFGVLIRGTAEIMDQLTSRGPKSGWEERLYNVFKTKYPVFEPWLEKFSLRSDPGSMIWVKVKPSKMTWWRFWNFKTLTFPPGAENTSHASGS